MTEKEVQNAILAWAASRTDLRLWRANSGVAKTMDGKRTVKFGVNGQADLSGILRDGRRLEIEVKSPTGRQSESQKKFQSMITRFGGVYVLARSVKDVEDSV